MKRRVAALLSILLIALIAVSCSETPETVPEYDAGTAVEGSIDLNGQKLIYGMVNDYFFEGQDSTLSYINNTELGDLAVKRLKDVEKNYNCTVTFYPVARAGEYTYMNAVAGAYVFDMISEESYWLLDFLKSGAFVDLTGLDNLDVFDETKWGNRYMRMSTMDNGAIYGLLPAQHPMRISNSISNILAVNEKYITDLVETDPRDYYENGEWTWTTFDRCLRDYAHTNNITNEYIYSFGCCFEYGRFYYAIAASNGIDFITLNDDGSFKLGYFSQAAVDAYNQAKEWMTGDTASCFNVETKNLQQFIDGQSVITLCDAYQVLSNSDSIAYKMEQFGIVPFPTGPSASDPHDFGTSYESADFTLAIPATAKDPEVSALVLDAIYEPFEGFETRENVIEYLNRNYFLDSRDATLFLEIADTDHVYYHDHFHGMTEMFSQLAGQAAVSKAVESFESRYNTIVEKYVLPEYKTVAEYEEYFHD